MPGVEVLRDAGVVPSPTALLDAAYVAQVRSPEEIFNRVFEVFLLLGTLVGVVVLAYMLYKAYKYREGSGHGFDESEAPELGEMPRGGGGGKKLFVSFGISACIVLGLILWTYGLLLDVENGVSSQTAQAEALEDPLEVQVEGYQFGWTFTYPNNHSQNSLRVPTDRAVRLSITSRDVMHNFGIRGLGLKGDAIPQQETHTWFVADENETGTYEAVCYELCGTGHSYMTAEVTVVPQDDFQDWYQNTSDAS